MFRYLGPVLCLLVLSILSFPLTVHSAEINGASKISGSAEGAFRKIVGLWRAEKYEDLYEQGKLESQKIISRPDFVRLMQKSNVRLQCCWTTIQNVKAIPISHDDVYLSVTLGYDNFYNVESQSGRISRDRWDTSSVFKQETFLLNREEERWTIDLVDILSAGGYILMDQR